MNITDVEVVSGGHRSWSDFSNGVTTVLDKVTSLLDTTTAEITETVTPRQLHKIIGLTFAKERLTFLSGIVSSINSAIAGATVVKK